MKDFWTKPLPPRARMLSWLARHSQIVGLENETDESIGVLFLETVAEFNAGRVES